MGVWNLSPNPVILHIIVTDMHDAGTRAPAFQYLDPGYRFSFRKL